jgi:hypothetical protein
MIRPVVAVGRDYVLSTSTSGFAFFKRDSAGNIDTTKAVPNLVDFSTLFATQVTNYNNEVATINGQYAGVVPVANQVPTPTSPCQSVDYYNSPIPGSIADILPVNPPGCANALYDGDTVYDEYSGHFFMMVKVRRPVWTCDTANGPGGTGWWDGVQATSTTPVDPCNPTIPAGQSPPAWAAGYANVMSGRAIFVAVSRCNALGVDCENPVNGFNTYTLAEAHADWAQIVVNRGLVMVNYHDKGSYYGVSPLGRIWGFGANDLINGTLSTTTVPPTPSFYFGSNSFKTTNGLSNTLMFTEMQSPTSSDFPILVTMDGSSVAAFNIVPTDAGYIQAAALTPQSPALWDLSPWMKSLTVSGEALAPVTSTDPNGGAISQQYNAHPVWSAASTGAGGPGSLYWSFVNGAQGISAFRWPLTAASLSTQEATTPTHPSLSTGQGFQRWDVASGGSPDFPVLEHNQMTGDTVLLFHTYTNPGPGLFLEAAQYAAAGPLDPNFQTPVAIPTPNVTLSASKKVASAGGVVDILSNVSDPLRPQVFMTSVASTGGGKAAGYTPFLSQVPLQDTLIPPVIGATPSPMQIATGGAATTYIPFAAPGASVPTATVSCTAGGDLGQAQGFDIQPSGVTVALQVPPGLSGSFFEGVSCTNGIAVSISVTTTAATLTASPSSITIMQGSNAGPSMGTVYFNQTDPTQSACTTAYVIVSPLPTGVSGSIQANSLSLGVFWNAQPGTYTIQVSTSGCALDSNVNVTLHVIPYSCQPEAYCENQGVQGGLQCGSVADGCGGTDNCGPCGTGQVCSENMCCPTGEVWNSYFNACAAGGKGYKPPPCRGTTCS